MSRRPPRATLFPHTPLFRSELGAGVDPPPLVATEGPLLVVGGDDVLPQLGSEPLELVAEVAHNRAVATDRVLLLGEDRKSTRLNSSHANMSYAVFCLHKTNV